MHASALGFLSTLLVAPATAQAPTPAAPAESSTITVSTGTRLQAELQRQVATRRASRDSVYLVTTYPLSLNGVTVIPAGTYLQAAFDRVGKKPGVAHRPVLEIRVASLIYPNGYVARVSSRSRVVATTSVGADKDAHGLELPLIAMLASPFVGSAIGAADGGVRGAGTGMLIGTGVAVVPGILALSLAHNWVLEAGLPVEVEFLDSLAVDRARATAPGAVSNLGVIPPPPRRKATTGSCFSPGSPGTPDIVIPGTPGTPAIGNDPGTLPTPPTIISGTPPTAGNWYSC
jgi:hypothetical protein